MAAFLQLELLVGFIAHRGVEGIKPVLACNINASQSSDARRHSQHE
jgi:hypothetical protein